MSSGSAQINLIDSPIASTVVQQADLVTMEAFAVLVYGWFEGVTGGSSG
jgi:hypothetical protein